MVLPNSHNVAQAFSSHLDWMSLERITQHMLTHVTVDALPWHVRDLLQTSGSCSSCWVLQGSFPTPQWAIPQKATLFISYLHLQTGFSQWTFLPCSKISVCPSSFRHSSISKSWNMCMSEFGKTQLQRVTSVARTTDLHGCLPVLTHQTNYEIALRLLPTLKE